MKKIKSIALVLTAIVIAGTGCLKDKGFDNHEYGINDPDGSPSGVGFLTGIAYVNSVGLNVSADLQSITTPLTVSLLTGTLPSADVHVTVTIDPTIIDDYNTNQGTSYVALDPADYTLVSSDVIIPAGSSTGFAQINVPSTIALDANTTYALGVRITGADAGYTVATNEDEVLLKIGIKNAYDGKYELHGQFYHPTAAPSFPTFTIDVEMWTTGPNSVIMYSPDYDDFLHPWTAVTGGGLTAFGSQSPEYTVDPGTNEVTVQNVFAGAVTFYTMGIGFDNAGYDSRWDPTAKIMYDNFGYNLGAGGAFNPAASREWIDTLIYTGPR